MPEDDRDSHTVSNSSSSNALLWVPIVAVGSIGAGLLASRGISRLFSRPAASAVRRNAAAAAGESTSSGSASAGEAASESASSSSAVEIGELPPEAHTSLSAKTFRGLPYGGDFKSPMDTAEAALILGCRETSSKAVIEKRFRKLMILNHPDKGGSPYVAGKINEAKTILTRTK